VYQQVACPSRHTHTNLVHLSEEAMSQDFSHLQVMLTETPGSNRGLAVQGRSGGYVYTPGVQVARALGSFCYVFCGFMLCVHCPISVVCNPLNKCHLCLCMFRCMNGIGH